jgi:hypothetical protein
MEGGNIFEPINLPIQNHPQNPPLPNQPPKEHYIATNITNNYNNK